MPVPDPDREGRAVVPAGQLASVWPCPPEGPDQPRANWLQAAVHRLVATCTRPGDPVLLLTPPPDDMPAAGRRATPAARVTDTGWSVIRLGRTVQVRPAPATRPSESGPGPRIPDDGPDSDRRPLLVTVVEPTRTGWIHEVPWARLVTPDGLLAVISHSDSVAGLLIDPTDALATATRRHGLALLHRFVLLEISLDQLDARPTPLPAGTAARRVHSDLLLFRPIAFAAAREHS
jgi:hypothetical protein